MSEEGGKKKKIKNNKKATKDKKPFTLRLNDSIIVTASTIGKESTEIFKINDVDIDKIKVSDKKFHSKKHDSYKHFMNIILNTFL